MREQFRPTPIRRPASTVTTMPSDKPRKNGIPAKPFTPTLSATSRTQKSPLTPRLAGGGTPASYHTPHVSSKASTPLSSKEEISTPVSHLLSTNITPRSGSRNSRREGTATPPSDTPSISYPHRPSSNVGGPVSDHSPLVGNRRAEPPRTLRKKTSPDDIHNANAQSQPGSSAGSSVGSPMFFHASEARTSTSSSHEPETKPKPHVKQTSTPVFMYANGAAEEEPRSEGSDHAIHGSKRLADPPRSHIPTKLTAPSVSQFPQIQTSPPIDHRLSNHNTNPHMRTRSQTEQLQNAPVLRPPQQGQRPSIGSKRPSHSKSPSLDSPEHMRSRRPVLLSSPNITPHTVQVTSPHTVPTTASPSPISGVSESTPLSPPPTNTDHPLPLAQSPKKPDSHQGIHSPQANELAANARRERKVLDLEISNSSLLAINRTLEREMRKQNAELRRYRRLSRSGRLSIAGSMRSASGGGLSIVSETEDEFGEHLSLDSPEDLSETSDNDSSFAEDDTLSPGAVAEHDARHRIRDEKKFYLDLAKHQELLVDSQKMNQSIKRCLSWTEELLRDGKRALAYKVQVSDIDIGGRVLSSDDTEGGKGLLSSSTDLLGIPEDSVFTEEFHSNNADS